MGKRQNILYQDGSWKMFCCSKFSDYCLFFYEKLEIMSETDVSLVRKQALKTYTFAVDGNNATPT